jgi:hypothetical protein
MSHIAVNFEIEHLCILNTQTLDYLNCCPSRLGLKCHPCYKVLILFITLLEKAPNVGVVPTSFLPSFYTLM